MAILMKRAAPLHDASAKSVRRQPSTHSMCRSLTLALGRII
jgi:hypothetical protein